MNAPIRGTVLRDGVRVPAARWGRTVYLVRPDGSCPACGLPGCPGRLAHPSLDSTFLPDGEQPCGCPVPHDGECLLDAPGDVREARWPRPSSAAPTGRPRIGGAR